jgi:hypothetical protein
MDGCFAHERGANRCIAKIKKRPNGAVDDMGVNIGACGTFAKENWRIETPFKDPKAK